MAGGGCRGGGEPHGAGHRWPWRLLLLAWLSLGCGVGTVQDPALGTPVQVPKHPAPARPRRQPAQGAWGPWGPWSSCSSSCGDGVTLRTRRCLWSPEEGPCTGDPRQYRLCQLQGCPPGSVPFRAMQCSLYDNKPVLGTSARYSWVPFYGAPNVCDLNCLAVGHNFYYSFGRVLDGTRCGPGSLDLCVSGRCLSVGCDGILGSGARPDACGQCGGGHDSCLFVHQLFQGAEPSSGYFGYMNVTKIPAGATHIKVTDKSRNYLALMMSDGRYVLNGDWSIAWPGPLEAAGTRLRYARAPDGTESLEAPGPTAEDLHLMVLLQEPNPGRGCWWLSGDAVPSQVRVKLRPHVQQFLESLSKTYEIVIFTTAKQDYAKKVLDVLDPKKKLIRHCLSQQDCLCACGCYWKDLTCLGRDLAKTVALDHTIQGVTTQAANWILVPRWWGDPRDKELLRLIPVLEQLGHADDVRPEIQRHFSHCRLPTRD
ncbi:ADAMTS-like protein 5 isoform B [Patagioenas fasciata monilis]|uniref:ADAMTS-like protein 5 isoform B n=1 Tax=Patagioenas fasciata monilis TaxID=372326 RepID=A0A1V4KQ97_PATFA|nr:ADAMTS-like protein 5 isoform B [Patagioenas fasciata monilis]